MSSLPITLSGRSQYQSELHEVARHRIAERIAIRLIEEVGQSKFMAMFWYGLFYSMMHVNMGLRPKP